MSVKVVATLDGATVVALLKELTPMQLALGDADQPNRWLELHAPGSVAFVAGEGLRIRTTARLGWTVAGVSLVFTLKRLTVLLRPVLDAGGLRLNLVATIVDADLENVPALIDLSLIEHVNGRLAAQPEALGWTFSETLGVHLEMPARLSPLAAFEMATEAPALEVGPDALRFSLALPMHFLRNPSAADDEAEGERELAERVGAELEPGAARG